MRPIPLTLLTVALIGAAATLATTGSPARAFLLIGAALILILERTHPQ